MSLRGLGIRLFQGVSDMRLRAAFVIGILASQIASAATTRSPDIRFCGIGQNPNSQDVLILDLLNHRMSSSDAENTFDVLENSLAIGITGELPIALPRTTHISPSTATAWRLGAYSFTMSKLSDRDLDWQLIFSHPIYKPGDTAPKYALSTLYSQSKGVIGLKQILYLPKNRKVVQELFSCGKDHLTATLLKTSRKKSR